MIYDWKKFSDGGNAKPEGRRSDVLMSDHREYYIL